MRRLCVLISAAFVLGAQPATAAEPSDTTMPYPGAVALSEESAGVWVYKSFPQFLPLYLFKGEPPGRSLCDRSCTAVWPIIQAQSTDKPVGFWTIVKRDDGRFQWAYKNSPVYTYFEDHPGDPKGVGKDMDWYLYEQGYTYIDGAWVQASPPSVAAHTRQTEKAKKIQATAELLRP